MMSGGRLAVFSKVTLGNVEDRRTESEISDESGNCVAVVYEANDGWHVEMLATVSPEQTESFNRIVAEAKDGLSHYVNRLGNNPPPGVTGAGLSLWLMERDDGTVLGLDFRNL